jgi:hypothetical protein
MQVTTDKQLVHKILNMNLNTIDASAFITLGTGYVDGSNFIAIKVRDVSLDNTVIGPIMLALGDPSKSMWDTVSRGLYDALIARGEISGVVE